MKYLIFDEESPLEERLEEIEYHLDMLLKLSSQLGAIMVPVSEAQDHLQTLDFLNQQIQFFSEYKSYLLEKSDQVV